MAAGVDLYAYHRALLADAWQQG